LALALAVKPVSRINIARLWHIWYEEVNFCFKAYRRVAENSQQKKTPRVAAFNVPGQAEPDRSTVRVYKRRALQILSNIKKLKFLL
jgi:hypothetical protein